MEAGNRSTGAGFLVTLRRILLTVFGLQGSECSISSTQFDYVQIITKRVRKPMSAPSGFDAAPA
jgi:hypothetical protein